MKNSFKKIVFPTAVLALVGILFLMLQHKTSAPDVTFTTIEGKQISMESLKSKVVLVNFWATDCPGCIEEIPKLVETYRHYHDKGFEIIAVAMPYDVPSQVLNYAQKNALPFPVMMDGNNDIVSKFDDVRLTPTTFLIDGKGQIIRKVIGEIDFNVLRQTLDAQLTTTSQKATL